jgi:hypothetical protein
MWNTPRNLFQCKVVMNAHSMRVIAGQYVAYLDACGVHEAQHPMGHHASRDEAIAHAKWLLVNVERTGEAQQFFLAMGILFASGAVTLSEILQDAPTRPAA